MRKIIQGVQKFQDEIFPEQREVFEKLAKGQEPLALFITCSDSRIVPNHITQTEPGELFIIRNAGNMVPPQSDVTGGVSATIEYAVLALGIKDIIICGHSQCGAMKGVLHPEAVQSMPKVAAWLHHGELARQVVLENYQDLSEEEKLEVLIKENVLAQLEHLKTHPSVAARLVAGAIQLHGWHFDIATGRVSAFDPEAHGFVPLDGERIMAAGPRRRPLARFAGVKEGA